MLSNFNLVRSVFVLWACLSAASTLYAWVPSDSPVTPEEAPGISAERRPSGAAVTVPDLTPGDHALTPKNPPGVTPSAEEREEFKRLEAYLRTVSGEEEKLRQILKREYASRLNAGKDAGRAVVNDRALDLYARWIHASAAAYIRGDADIPGRMAKEFPAIFQSPGEIRPEFGRFMEANGLSELIVLEPMTAGPDGLSLAQARRAVAVLKTVFGDDPAGMYRELEARLLQNVFEVESALSRAARTAE